MARIATETEPDFPIYEAAPLPSNEEARNARVHRSGVMDVQQEDRYGLYVDLAKLITDCPVAYTGLLDQDRQFFWLFRDLCGWTGFRSCAAPTRCCGVG